MHGRLELRSLLLPDERASYEDGDKHLTVENDTVDTILNKDEFREGLRYVHKLYDEGLMYSESYAQDSTQMKSLNSRFAQRCGKLSHRRAHDRHGRRLRSLQNLCDGSSPEGPQGHQSCSYYEYGNLRVGAFAITSACNDPEVAFKLADFMYTEDSSVRLRQGVKDVDWRMAKEGETTLRRKARHLCPHHASCHKRRRAEPAFGNSGMFRESNDSFIGAWAVQDGFDIRSLDGIEQLLIEQTWPYDGFEPKQTLPPVVLHRGGGPPRFSTSEVEVQKYAIRSRGVLFITGQRPGHRLGFLCCNPRLTWAWTVWWSCTTPPTSASM